MSIKRLMAVLCGGLLAVSALSARAQDTTTEDGKKSCCSSGEGAPSCCSSGCEHHSAKMKCSLTGQTMDSCCCRRTEDGKLHCTLADKDVDTCCCKPADEGEGGEGHHHHTEGNEPQQ
jgi:hypothetical protein